MPKKLMASDCEGSQVGGLVIVSACGFNEVASIQRMGITKPIAKTMSTMWVNASPKSRFRDLEALEGCIRL